MSEQYLDLITAKQPRDFKPARPTEAMSIDGDYVLETLARLRHSLVHFLQLSDTRAKTTGPEWKYFNVVSLLVKALQVSLGHTDAAPPPLATCASSIRSTLESLEELTTNFPESSLSESNVLYAVTDTHALCYLWETAMAIKQTVAFALALHDRHAAHGAKTGLGLHSAAVAVFKALDVLAADMLASAKAHVKTTKEKLGEGGWLDRVLDWTFGPDGEEDEVAVAIAALVGGRAGVEEWAGRVLESWVENFKGWSVVRMD